MINLRNVEDAEMLAQAIVNTIHDPLLVLDDSFHVRVASRSFYETFKVDAENTQGRLLFSLGNSQWEIPARGGGVGTAIVQALVKQFGATIITIVNSAGTSVSSSRVDITANFPDAACPFAMKHSPQTRIGAVGLTGGQPFAIWVSPRTCRAGKCLTIR